MTNIKLTASRERNHAAYIDFSQDREPGDSAEQVIVDITDLNFVPTQLIFDVNEDGTILGVELL